jgi:hypothetical protein
MQQIYVVRGTERAGPFNEAEMRAQLAAGAVTGESMVWWDGLPEWTPLSRTPLAAPPVPSGPLKLAAVQIPQAPASGSKATSTVLIVVLAIGGVFLVLAFVSVVAISVLIALGNQVKTVFTTISSQVQVAPPGSGN